MNQDKNFSPENSNYDDTEKIKRPEPGINSYTSPTTSHTNTRNFYSDRSYQSLYDQARPEPGYSDSTNPNYGPRYEEACFYENMHAPKTKIKKKSNIFDLLTLISALLLIASLFLPQFDQFPPELEFISRNSSLFNLGKTLSLLARLDSRIDHLAIIHYIIFMCIGIFSVLVLLMSIFKRRGLRLVFSFLAALPSSAVFC